MGKGHVTSPSDLVSVVEGAMEKEGPLCLVSTTETPRI